MPSSKPHLHIIATGGTIAGVANSPSACTGYSAGVLPVENLLAEIAPLCPQFRLSAHQLTAINSKDADPAFWQLLGQAVQVALRQPDIDAVVITHGTDTLEETAFYLQLVLETNKPVVLTGAMRPATALSADGPMNLLQALLTAADPHASERGILVVMNQRILGACNVMKRHTQRVDAFECPDTGPMGSVQEQRVLWFQPAGLPAPLFNIDTPLASVDILYGYAGISRSWVQAACQSGCSGLIWAGTGNGSMSLTVQEVLAQAVRQGLTVVRASRVGAGYVLPNGDCDDDQHGFFSAGILSPQKARILLALALGKLKQSSVESKRRQQTLQRWFGHY